MIFFVIFYFVQRKNKGGKEKESEVDSANASGTQALERRRKKKALKMNLR